MYLERFISFFGGEGGMNVLLLLESNSTCCNIMREHNGLSGYDGIGHFTDVCLVTWPLSGSEAGRDLLFTCRSCCSHAHHSAFTNEKHEVCMKTRSSPASLPLKGQSGAQSFFDSLSAVGHREKLWDNVISLDILLIFGLVLSRTATN